MPNVIKRPGTPVDDLPIDEELIRDSVDATLNMGLSTSTRDDIDGKTRALIGHMNLLLSDGLGTDDDRSAGAGGTSRAA
ncbi:hypothetical protein ACGFW5_03695 [Streptomyces sp. NPDC048416]|uniref:hypothetical protein n=1 Tax=Streptomyces sp. NPDC048416 TaxID=3365546 RepID=UPI00371CAF2C